MNLDTVRKCAQIAADMRRSALGAVDEDILELLAELDAPPAEEPVKQTRKSRVTVDDAA